jgi:cytochrome c554/c'-like protein
VSLRLRRAGAGRQVRIAVLLCLAVLAACEDSPKAASPTDTFLGWYWTRPLPSQQKAPSGTRAHAVSLDPATCGTCHVEQFEGWRRSLHSRAMGPGLLGQLVNMPPHATQEHQECLRCHAPLGEQAESLVASLVGEKKAEAPGGRALHEQGLVCAACHVRGDRWYGPPRRDGSQPAGDTPQFPHGGWTASAAFEDSRFCAACHQFGKDGYALNGKPLENTYEEWKASRHAREGRTCQSCHMPERRHLWRGIHDPEMVKTGITIRTTSPATGSGVVTAALAIENSGVGHHFPTYVTPRIVVEIHQEDATGKRLEGTLREHVIARQVPLDLSRELADTRIAPGAQAVLDYRAARHADAAFLSFRVTVEPDAFYAAFYRSLLEANQAGAGEALLRQALRDATASVFVLYSERVPLPVPIVAR